MKKGFGYLLVMMAVCLVLGGCATPLPQGTLYTEVGFPGGVGPGEVAYSKTGTATSKSFFGLIATGDASVSAAVKEGNIQRIKYIDYKSKNILGVYGEYTTTVYGD